MFNAVLIDRAEYPWERECPLFRPLTGFGQVATGNAMSWWTKDRIRIMRECLDNKMSQTETAQVLRCTKNMVSGKSRQLWGGWPSGRQPMPEKPANRTPPPADRLTTAQRDYLRRSWKTPHKTRDEMARHLGISVDVLRKMAAALKLGPKKSERFRPAVTSTSAFKCTLTPWPADMPSFEDHPLADKVGRRVFIPVRRNPLHTG